MCLLCSDGKYAGEIGKTECTPCAAGTSQSATGSSVCLACDHGFSQAQVGQALCTQCPPGKYTMANDITVRQDSCSVLNGNSSQQLPLHTHLTKTELPLYKLIDNQHHSPNINERQTPSSSSRYWSSNPILAIRPFILTWIRLS